MQIRPTIVLTSLFYNVFKISFDYFDYLIILILSKRRGKKMQEVSVHQCNIWYCSLKISVEKKTCITEIKYLLQHWKKPRRHLMQKIINTSCEFRSWWQCHSWACTITTLHWPISASVFSMKQKAWESSIAIIWQTSLFLAAFVTVRLFKSHYFSDT